MDDRPQDPKQPDRRACAVNMTFHYSVGVIAVAIAGALGWLAWRFLSG